MKEGEGEAEIKSLREVSFEGMKWGKKLRVMRDGRDKD